MLYTLFQVVKLRLDWIVGLSADHVVELVLDHGILGCPVYKEKWKWYSVLDS